MGRDPGDETDFHDVAGANVGEWAKDGDWVKIDPRFEVRPVGEPIVIPPPVSPLTLKILHDVADERIRQDVKWGLQDHDPMYWNSVLGEEYGEVCEAALDYVDEHHEDDEDHYRTELIHTAAVAVAAIETLDRARAKREEIIRRMPSGEQDAWRSHLA